MKLRWIKQLIVRDSYSPLHNTSRESSTSYLQLPQSQRGNLSSRFVSQIIRYDETNEARQRLLSFVQHPENAEHTETPDESFVALDESINSDAILQDNALSFQSLLPQFPSLNPSNTHTLNSSHHEPSESSQLSANPTKTYERRSRSRSSFPSNLESINESSEDYFISLDSPESTPRHQVQIHKEALRQPPPDSPTPPLPPPVDILSDEEIDDHLPAQLTRPPTWVPPNRSNPSQIQGSDPPRLDPRRDATTSRPRDTRQAVRYVFPEPSLSSAMYLPMPHPSVAMRPPRQFYGYPNALTVNRQNLPGYAIIRDGLTQTDIRSRSFLPRSREPIIGQDVAGSTSHIEVPFSMRDLPLPKLPPVGSHEENYNYDKDQITPNVTIYPSIYKRSERELEQEFKDETAYTKNLRLISKNYYVKSRLPVLQKASPKSSAIKPTNEYECNDGKTVKREKRKNKNIISNLPRLFSSKRNKAEETREPECKKRIMDFSKSKEKINSGSDVQGERKKGSIV